MVYFEGGYKETKVYKLELLSPGHIIYGPAIIMDSLNTILVEPGCKAAVTLRGDIQITIGASFESKVTICLDAIQLSIFSHRFMSIAEQMGRFV